MKQEDHMTYANLSELRNQHPAWRLLAAERSSFIAAFLYSEFVANNCRQVVESQLIEDLDNFIYDLHEINHGEDIIRPAKDYLNSWCDSQHSWLRKFYNSNGEACYDLTSAAQKAISWLMGLKKQEFLGTESRIKTVFSLLTEVDQETNPDAGQRMAQLQKKRAEIDQEIEALKQGSKLPILDSLQLKERYLQASSISQSILADFREVEENLRALDRQLMEKIITWKSGKGELLKEFFKERDMIMDSEQGRSFSAFWSFLMNSDNKSRLDGILQRLSRVDCLAEVEQETGMSHIRHEWAQGAANVQTTLISLSKQLRQYVDQTNLMQEQYILELMGDIADSAVQVKDNFPTSLIMEMDETSPLIELPMERPLFVPAIKTNIADTPLEKAQEQDGVRPEIHQVYVDISLLQQRVAETIKFINGKSNDEAASSTNNDYLNNDLAAGGQGISLEHVLEKYPLEKGLTELLSYMLIASRQGATFEKAGQTTVQYELPDVGNFGNNVETKGNGMQPNKLAGSKKIIQASHESLAKSVDVVNAKDNDIKKHNPMKLQAVMDKIIFSANVVGSADNENMKGGTQS